jgi:hydrogenase-4 component E
MDPGGVIGSGSGMGEELFGQLLDLAAGTLLLCAVAVAWRRSVRALVRILAVQGATLALLVAVLAADRGDGALAGVAVGVLVLKGGLVPWLLGQAAGGRRAQAETEPLVNVPASLLAAAGLTALAYAVARPIVALGPGPALQAAPIGIAVFLIGFFVLLTRRRAISQAVGFLLVDNGIATVAFLTADGVPLVVELGASLDLLLAVLILQVLTTRIRHTFGDTDLDGLRELHD